MTADTTPPPATGSGRGGRKRDHSRDGDILDAALEVLAETGYDGMTMDLVAARAGAGKATVYRRWASKPLMVLDAVIRMSEHEIDLDALPDTGTLRGDLTAMIAAEHIDEGQRRLRVMSAVTSMLPHLDDPDLATKITAASSQPWITANHTLLQRSIDRGDIPPDTDIDLFAQLIPGLCYFRVCMENKPLDGFFITTIIDTILLPALDLPAAHSSTVVGDVTAGP